MGWCAVACGSPLPTAPYAAFRILDLRPTTPCVGVPAPVSRLPRSGWSPSGEPGGRCSAKRVIGLGTCALAIAIDAGSPTTCCSARAWAVSSACGRSYGSASRESRRVRPGVDMEACAATARSWGGIRRWGGLAARAGWGASRGRGSPAGARALAGGGGQWSAPSESCPGAGGAGAARASGPRGWTRPLVRGRSGRRHARLGAWPHATEKHAAVTTSSSPGPNRFPVRVGAVATGATDFPGACRAWTTSTTSGCSIALYYARASVQTKSRLTSRG